MASLSSLSLKLVGRNSRVSTTHSSLSIFTSRKYSAPESNSEYRPTDSHLDEEERTRIDNLRNVSRLPFNHYRLYHGQPPDLPYKDLHRRKMLYAQFGVASGEDPRILWPSRVKLLDQELEEHEEGGLPILDRFAQLESEKQVAEGNKMERRKQIAKNMSQMTKWIQEYRKKHEAVEKAAKEKATKKEALLQEARDYYGYKIQANDPKFQKMMEEKELQEKTEKKKRKREEKLQRHAQHSSSQTQGVNKQE